MDLYDAAAAYSDAWTAHMAALTAHNAASGAFWGAQPGADMTALSLACNEAEARMALAAAAVVRAQNALLETARGI